MAISGETIQQINSLHYKNNKEEQEIEEVLHASLKEANLIKQKVKDPELKEKFQQEYDELENVILESVNNDFQISHSERMAIMLELSDVITLAEKHNISTEFRKRDSFLGILSGVSEKDVKGVENEAKKLLNKGITNYTQDEAFVVLQHLNKEHGDFEEGLFAGLDEDSLSELRGMTKKDVNIYQERLIDKVLGIGNKGFNHEYVRSYDSEKGNFLVKIVDYEKNLITDDISKINSETLAYYLLYLQSTGSMNADTLIEKLGSENISQLKMLWEENGASTTLNLLSKYGLKDIIKNIISVDITTYGIDDIKMIENYNDLDNSYILNNQRNIDKIIPLITSEEKILSLLEEKSFSLDLLNKSLIGNHKILEKGFISAVGISKISLENLKDLNVLNILLNKYQGNLINFIIQKLEPEINNDLLLKQYLTAFIQSIDNSNNIISSYTKNILFEGISTNENKESIIMNVENFIKGKDREGNQENIKKFIQEYGIYGNEKIFADYINNGGEITSEIFFNVRDLGIAEAVINKYGLMFLAFFNEEIFREYPSLFKLVLSKLTKDDYVNYINILPLNSPENLIYYVYTIEENIKDEDEREEIYNSYQFSNKVLNLLSGLNEINIPQNYKKSFDILIKKIKTNNEELKSDVEKIKEIKVKISDKISGMKSEEKINKIINSLPNLLKKETGVDFSIEESKAIIGYLRNNNFDNTKLVLTLIKDKSGNNSKKISKILNLFLSDAIYIQSEELSALHKQNPELGIDEITQGFTSYLSLSNRDIASLKEDDITNYLNTLDISDTEKEKYKSIINNYINININIELKDNFRDSHILQTMIDEGLDENEFNNYLENVKITPYSEISKKYSINTRLEEIYISEYYEYLESIEIKDEGNQLTGNNKTIGATLEDINSIQYIFHNDPRINTSNGRPEIITKNGNNAVLTNNDLIAIQQNPDNLENIINFSNILDETGFSNLWKIKDSIFQSIDNTIGIGFDIKGDFLNTNELRIVFNTILKSVGFPTMSGQTNQKSIISYVKNLNGNQLGGETRDVNRDGDSKIEDIFFKEYFPKNTNMGFKSSKFEQAIS